MTKHKRLRHIAGEPSRHDPWRSAKTYADLIQANCAFLRGELPQTPYHLGPIAPETIPLTGGLLELHGRGVLTTCGQPALREISKCKDEHGKRRTPDQRHTGHPGRVRQLVRAPLLRDQGESRSNQRQTLFSEVATIYPHRIFGDRGRFRPAGTEHRARAAGHLRCQPLRTQLVWRRHRADAHPDVRGTRLSEV